MKPNNRLDKEPLPREKDIYEWAIGFLLAVVAFLIPLKFGLPNLDVSSPLIPTDIVGLPGILGAFFTAVFSLKFRSALRVVSGALSNPWPEEMTQILVILVFFLWGVRSFSRRRVVLRLTKLDAAMWFFLLVGLVATLLSPSVHSSVVILKQFVSYALLYFVVVHAVETPHLQKRIIKCFLVSTSIVAFLGLYQFAFGLEEMARDVRQLLAPELRDAYLARITRRRIFSVFVYPNSLAGFLLVAFPLTLLYMSYHGEWFTKKNVLKLVAYVIVLPLPCLVSFLLTQSKASFLALFLIAAGSVLVGRKKLRLRPKVLLAGSLAVLVAVSAILLSPVGRRLLVEKGGYTFSARLDYWTAGWRMVETSPAIGSGFNSFGLLYPLYREPGPHETQSAHNNYLQVLVETGLVGLVLFLGVWALGLGVGWRYVRRYLRGEGGDSFKNAVVLSAFLGICCFLLHSFADFDLYVPGIAMSVWLLLGLMVRNARQTEGHQFQLTNRSATVGVVVLVAVCGFGVFFTSKTLNANSHLSLAQSLIENTDPPPSFDDYETAIVELEKALKWDRSNHNLHTYLAGIYFRLGRYDDALDEYTTAGRLHRFSAMTAHSIARTTLAKMKENGNVNWDEILAGFRRAVHYSPASPFHRLVYAYYLAQSGDQKGSERELKQVKRLDESGKEALDTARLIYRSDPFVSDLERFLAASSATSSP